MNEPFPLFFVKASEALGRYDEISENVRNLAARYSGETFSKVLDMCCGVGHYALAMAEAGFHVTAVDLSEEQIADAKENRGHPGVSYKVGSMEEPLAEAPFDIITNTYSSFGYMASVEEDQKVLENWCNMLRPGGVLIMELPDIERAQHTFSYPNCHLDHVVGGLREERWMDWDSQMLTARYSQNGKSYTGGTRLYTAEQLKGMARKAGFTRTTGFGSYAFEPKQKHNLLVLECMK